MPQQVHMIIQVMVLHQQTLIYQVKLYPQQHQVKVQYILQIQESQYQIQQFKNQEIYQIPKKKIVNFME